MGHGELETQLWNLSFVTVAATVMGGCGPFVIPGGDTDTQTGTGADAGTDPSGRPTTDPSDTDPSDTDPGDTEPPHPPGWCDGLEDCEPGYECIDQTCVPSDDCDTDCCYDTGYDYCYYDKFCSSDAECGSYGICDYYGGPGGCAYVYILYDCPDVLEVEALTLPTEVGGAFMSMAFVDSNGDAARDLVVARTGGVELLQGLGAPPIPLPVPPGAEMTDIDSADIDADGDTDLVATTAEGSLLVMMGDGAGGFGPAVEQPTGLPALLKIEALHRSGDATPDVVVTTDLQAVIVETDDTGAFVGNMELPTGPVVSLVETNLDDDEYDDLVIQDDEAGWRFHGDLSGNVIEGGPLPGLVHGDRRLAAGPIDVGAPYETVGYSSMGSWALFELWPNWSSPRFFGVLGVAGITGAVGDFDGDGTGDVITGGAGDPIVFLRGDSFQPSLTCRSTYYDLAAGLGPLEVGDFDGNGRADVVQWSVSGDVTVLLTQ